MTEPGTHEIDQLRARLGSLIERADLGAGTEEIASEALEELAVVVEELQAQNSELITSRNDLEAERERYRDLFQTIPDGYVVTDSLGIMREVNETAATLFGRTRRRLVGKALGTLIETKDRRAFYAQLSRIHAEGPGAQLSINLSVHDGITIPANVRATVATSGATNETEIRWLIHDRRADITTQQRRASEERLRALFDTATVGIVLTDEAGTLIFSNQHADDLVGRDPAAVDLDAWLHAVHPDDRQHVLTALATCRNEGRHAKVRHRICAGDTERWVDHGMSPSRSPDGALNGSISTITDVTAEHQARARLEVAIEFNDAILDTVGALVIVLNPDGYIERFNNACETAVGRSAESVIGRHYLNELIPADQRTRTELAFTGIVNDGTPVSFENDWITANGDRRTISWTNTTLRDADGATRVVIGTGIDVTETRVLQHRLARADRLESIGRLAAGIAHDFNNTLSTLRLRLDRLARRLDDADNLEDIAAANTTIDRTQHIIADLVSFSRQQQLHPQPTDINIEAQRVTTLIADLLGDTITTHLHLTDEPAIAYVDPGRLEQALTNLLLNARDAMPDGGTITVTTSIDNFTAENAPAGSELATGDYVRLSVVDTGTGIDPRHTPHIFDPYFTTKPPANRHRSRPCHHPWHRHPDRRRDRGRQCSRRGHHTHPLAPTRERRRRQHDHPTPDAT